MRPTPSSSALLLRCADAAGYGAVSYLDDEPVAPSAKSGLGYWRAFLSLFFVIL